MIYSICRCSIDYTRGGYVYSSRGGGTCHLVDRTSGSTSGSTTGQTFSMALKLGYSSKVSFTFHVLK